MCSTDSDPGNNVALINPCECVPNLEELRRKFDVIYFLDLCAAIEAAILYDRLYITATPGQVQSRY
jgi:hypothetical protein